MEIHAFFLISARVSSFSLLFSSRSVVDLVIVLAVTNQLDSNSESKKNLITALWATSISGGARFSPCSEFNLTIEDLSFIFPSRSLSAWFACSLKTKRRKKQRSTHSGTFAYSTPISFPSFSNIKTSSIVIKTLRSFPSTST